MASNRLGDRDPIRGGSGGFPDGNRPKEPDPVREAG
jgi:hypothetical protein